MKLQQTPFLLIVVMTASIVVVTIVSIWLLYATAFAQQTNRLVEVAHSQARLIETIIEHEIRNDKDTNHTSAASSALAQIIQAHAKFEGFGETGEFTLGETVGGQIKFLLSHRHYDMDKLKPVPMASALAEPMRRALQQKSGTIVALDYRGVAVLAAHEPVAGMNWGIVAKIDMAEIRAPFIQAGVYSAIVAMLMILIGSVIFLRITQPMIQKIKDSESQFRHLFDSSERKYQTLFGASNDAMIIFADDEIIDCNDAAFQMFACESRDEILGKHPGELSPKKQPDGSSSASLANEKIATAFEAGSNYFEWTHQRINGEEFSAEVLLTAINLGERSVIQATVRDLTQRKQIEKDLERQRILFEAVFRDIPSAMLIANLDREIVMCNPAFTQTFGYESEEIIGKQTAFLYESIDEFERQGRERFNLTAEQKLKPYVVKYRHKNGHLFPGETVGFAVNNDSGDHIAFIGVVRDITDRIQAEEKLNRQKTELEASNKELESYSYSIAHDLRSPLRAVTSFSQILLEDAKGQLSAEQLQDLSRIVAAGKNMAQLIDDILELSRITRRELQMGNVNLSNLAKDIAERLDQTCPDKKIHWQIQDNIIVRGDSTLLTVALQNLLENAWKFTRDRSVAQIEVGKLQIDKKIAFFVKDNGVGFNMEYKTNLFKPFRRLHSKEFEGTGIGLATVHRIIQRHNGRVWGEAVEDQGATFYFTLGDEVIQHPGV